MPVDFSKTELGKGISLTRIYDDKFKSVSVYVFFVKKIAKESVTADALLAKLLITSNSKIKSRTELNKELMRLYGSSIAVASARAGDHQMIGLCANCLSDKFTIGDEKITERVTDIMLDCILAPDINENGFNEKYFSLRKQDLIDTVRASVNDKRGYAIIQARKEIYKDEPAAIPSYGELEQAESIENLQTVEEYHDLLKNAKIELFVVGNSDIEKVVPKLTEAFIALDRGEIDSISFKVPSPVKKEVSNIEEKLDVSQTKLVMAFKTENDDVYANKLMAMLYGASPFSKLFMNVREKLSLCYYCSAGFSDTKNVMIVDSGTEQKNVETAKQEIIRQLELVAKGDFTDEELDNTKLALCSGFKSNYDNTSDMAAWYLTQYTRGTACTPDEICEQIRGISRERIIKAAADMKLDTVYIVSPDEEREGADDEN
ncbi:MAG: insulinase family protein [Ruminococcus sp.]|nr:insulinase family protein [Ruminococcus sp.]